MSHIDQLCVSTIRLLSAQGVQKANSGHPGMPMGAAPMAYALWGKEMKHNPADPNFINRDRFVLSAGHGSMLLYSLLHLFGYGLTIDDLQNFRQWDSKTPGHPEYGHTIGVETTTGPLGAGVSTAVGFAMAEARLAAKFNRKGYPVMDHYTYAIVGDGCLMEGISGEACSLAGTLKLNKLIVLYDSNSITIEGKTDLAFTENVAMRYEAYGWNVRTVVDGNDAVAIQNAIKHAKESDKPTLIEVKTIIGFGSPRQGTAQAHGEPLGEENIAKTKQTLGWTYEDAFYVPGEVAKEMLACAKKGQKAQDEWNQLFDHYRIAHPDLAKEWDVWFSKELPVDLLNDEEFWAFSGKMATRKSSGEVLQRLFARVPNLFGGSADLAPSNLSDIKGQPFFSAKERDAVNIHFGVREHAMAAITNGIALHGGLRGYCATFFVFSDYMKGNMRLSALMGLPVVYILTHDSIGVGEDGPTHQPVEHLAGLRAMPGLNVFRPADANEVAAAWVSAMTSKQPTCLVLTRQDLPLYENAKKNALKGGYILSDCDTTPDVLLMASGSEVAQMMEAQGILKEKGVAARVISLPCWELFAKQSDDYKQSVIPKAVRARVSMEAGATLGWQQFVGLDGVAIGMDHFGASAPASVLFEKFGFTAQNAADQALRLLK